MKFFHSMAFRMAAFCIVGVLLTVFALFVSITLSEKDIKQIVVKNKIQIEEHEKKALKAITYVVYNRLATYDNLLYEKLNNSLFYMHESLRENGGFNKVSEATMNFEEKIPSPVVDNVMKSYNVYSTIFRRLGDGTMLRVSTNIINDGKRVVNTRISPKNQDGSPNVIIQTVLSGKTYKGRANVLGEWVNAIYEPVIENGRVVGMLFVSSTRKDSQEIIDQIRDSRYGNVFAAGIDGAEKGIMVMSMEESMESVGKNVLDLKNSKGENYWQQVIETCKQMPKNSVDYFEINYRNEKGKEYELSVAGMNYPEWNWAIGIALPKEEFEGASFELQNSLNYAVNWLKKEAYIVGIAMFFIIATASLIDVRYFKKTINSHINSFEKIGGGDMTLRLNSKTEDEMGEMARHFNGLMDNLQDFMKKIVAENSTIANAAEELSNVSRQLASGSEETVNQSNMVVSTTQEMTVNIKNMASYAEEASATAGEVASAAEEMSTNMSTIANAVKEMSTSINKISDNTHEVQQVITEATSKATEATNVVNKLGTAAKEIGEVTDVIKKIANKTNLLALNATIEAASAGESGKGFAVVAGEIKELANQSAESADGIANRISSIQNGTSAAIKVIHDVSEIILKINDSIKATVSYVEQQNKASDEIESNVAQANKGAKRVASAIGEVAKGANNMSSNAGEAAKGATDVSSNISNMSSVAKDSSQGAAQVNQNAGDLAKIASELSKTLNFYKVSA